MNPPLRVLQILGGLGMGGAETWLMELLRHWSASGTVQLDFLLTGGQCERFDGRALQLGARLHYLPYRRQQLARFTPAFRRLLRQGRYDALHDHADYAAGWHLALAAGRLPPVRVVHVHNPRLHIEASYAISPLRRLTAAGGKRLVQRLASHVCGTSAAILPLYGFHSGRARGPRVAAVPCGFPIDRFHAPRAADRRRVLAEFGWPADIQLALHAGRLDQALACPHPRNHKNTWLVLTIARLAALREPRFRLLLVGDGPSRSALQQVVQAWGLADRLRLIGIREDLPRLMRAADALLFPSAQEGLGMVAVEAQAAGLPVLASRAVPAEAIVVPHLYEALPLTAAPELWALRLLALLQRPRPDLPPDRALVAASPFNLSASAAALEAIYRSGR
ncbi:MAG: glycosyltransferase [Synechococcus sp.]|nr:glycosyltransferase [Synechococcus sp.]